MSKILVLSATSDIFNEDHGGRQRSANLIKALAKEHIVTVLCLTWDGREYDQEISASIHIKTVSVEANVIAASKRKSNELVNPTTDTLTGIYARYMRAYTTQMNDLIKKNDLVIIDHYAIGPFVKFIENTKIPIYYNSHNSETNLAEQLYPKGSYDIKLINEIERTIFNKAKSFSYCSEEDLNHIKKYFNIDNNPTYIPNGTTIPDDIKPGNGYNNKEILFVGSGHPPNHTAVKNIVELAKLMPDYNFTIAGSSTYILKNIDIPSNVTKIESISNEQVEELFKNAYAFINPIETGSGTHLKTMKALSYALPLISSTIGARGFSEKEKQECMLIADSNHEMIDAIHSIKNKKQYTEISTKAFELAKQYNWEIIGNKYLKTINQLFVKSVAEKIEPVKIISKKEKVLVYSIIRNEEQYIDMYYNQLKAMVTTFPEYEFYLSIYENDSDDRTKQKIYSKDWSIFKKVSILSENLKTINYGSTKDADRVKNLSIARNKAIEAGGFLNECDYVMMIESDFKFDMSAVSKILNFKYKEPDFDIVSAISIRNKHLYDAWATRKTPEFIKNEPVLDANYKIKIYDRYYSTSNGICLYKAKPFKEGVRYGWINTVTGEPDCDTVVVCQNFHEKGYSNIYIIHDAEVYHEHF